MFWSSLAKHGRVILFASYIEAFKKIKRSHGCKTLSAVCVRLQTGLCKTENTAAIAVYITS